MTPIEISKYSEDWPLRFERLKALLWPLVSDLANAMEHVGSTSVEGLAAKPIIADTNIFVASGFNRDSSSRRIIEALDRGLLLQAVFRNRGWLVL